MWLPLTTKTILTCPNDPAPLHNRGLPAQLQPKGLCGHATAVAHEQFPTHLALCLGVSVIFNTTRAVVKRFEQVTELTHPEVTRQPIAIEVSIPHGRRIRRTIHGRLGSIRHVPRPRQDGWYNGPRFVPQLRNNTALSKWYGT